MKVMYLTSHLPYPPISGGRTREYQLTRRISEVVELSIVVVTRTYAHDLSYAGHVESYCHSLKIFPSDHRRSKKESSRSTRTYPIQVLRNRSSAVEAHLGRSLGKSDFDILHVEGYYLMPLLPSQLAVPLLLVQQNVEYELARQRLQLGMCADTGGALRREYNRTRYWERSAWNRATMLAAVTSEDQRHICDVMASKQVALIPNGVDIWDKSIRRIDTQSWNVNCTSQGRRLLFVGNFEYYPNLDAASYLVTEVLPRVWDRIPDTRLVLAGNDPGNKLRRLCNQKGVDCTGRVSRLESYYNLADLVVCPLRIGGGVKVKILEAIAAGLPIVSSRIGVQGLPPGFESSIIVEDDPDRFAATVVDLLYDPQKRTAMRKAASRYVETLPT